MKSNKFIVSAITESPRHLAPRRDEQLNSLYNEDFEIKELANTLDQVQLVVSKRVTKELLSYNSEFEEKRN